MWATQLVADNNEVKEIVLISSADTGRITAIQIRAAPPRTAEQIDRDKQRTAPSLARPEPIA